MTLFQQLHKQHSLARVRSGGRSGFINRPVKVVLSTGYDCPPRIQIHGDIVVDYVWERQYGEGCRFTILQMYHKGVEVPQEQWEAIRDDQEIKFIYENGPKPEDLFWD